MSKFDREVHSKRLLQAMKEASEDLTAEGIRHALIGGLTMDFYAEARATKDVDFIVPAEAREALSGRSTRRLAIDGITYRIARVKIDVLFADEHLEDAIAVARQVEGIPILPPEEIAFLKLVKSSRPKDYQDVLAMLQANTIRRPKLRALIEEYAPEALDDFEQACAEADLED